MCQSEWNFNMKLEIVQEVQVNRSISPKADHTSIRQIFLAYLRWSCSWYSKALKSFDYNLSRLFSMAPFHGQIIYINIWRNTSLSMEICPYSYATLPSKTMLKMEIGFNTMRYWHELKTFFGITKAGVTI